MSSQVPCGLPRGAQTHRSRGFLGGMTPLGLYFGADRSTQVDPSNHTVSLFQRVGMQAVLCRLCGCSDAQSWSCQAYMGWEGRPTPASV